MRAWGSRSQYRPIETPLSSTSKPVDVTRGLLSIYPFKTFYIADLDAIERKGDNNEALTHLKTEFPDLAFWVDNGVADLARAQCWLDAGLGHLVLGSETQKDEHACPPPLPETIESSCRSTIAATHSWDLRRC